MTYDFRLKTSDSKTAYLEKSGCMLTFAYLSQGPNGL